MTPRLLHRRATALALILVAAVVVFPSSPLDALAPDERVRLVDIRGREVTLPPGPQRIVIDDGRYLLALSLLLDDPTAVLAGWPRDVNRIGEGVYARYKERFPKLETLPRVASSAGTFSLEQTLAVNPTVAIFSLNRGPTDAQISQLEELGVVAVFLDFFMDPLGNVDRSVELLGTIVGAAPEARRFLEFRSGRRQRIAERVASLGDERPDVFFEAHAGMSPECCNSPGKGNAAVYIEFAGGHNIGSDVLPGPVGKLSLEYILERDPAVYVATGGPHLARSAGLILGSGYSADASSEALARVASRPGFPYLSAVNSGRTHGLSHQLLNSPMDIVALELLALWLHPELFSDLDPAETLAEINRNFLAVPVEGTFWVSLDR